MADQRKCKNGSVPALRFEGFSDPWEQRRLGELFVESEDRSSDLEILSVSVANGIYPASDSDREINPGASLVNYKVVCKGDVVYNSMRMWQGAVDSSLHDGIVSPAYVVARPVSMTASRFFARLLKRPNLLCQYQRRSQGNSKDTQVLKFEEFAEIEVSVPLFRKEQEAIGSLADALDSLITLHQRKVDKLKTVKQSLLEKMFPREGENVPEIRFEGFTDPWEQRKLGELYEKAGRKNSGEYGGESIISVANMRFSPADRELAEGYLETYNVMDLGDIAFEGNRSKHFAHGRFVENDIGPGIVSHVFDVFRPKTQYDLAYWKYAINNERVMGAILVRSTKASTMMHNLVAADFLKESMPVPTVPEQSLIGALFVKIDSLITLHQRELEILKNLKQACLEKMFV